MMYLEITTYELTSVLCSGKFALPSVLRVVIFMWRKMKTLIHNWISSRIYHTEKIRYIFFMSLACSKSVRCHTTKWSSLKGRNGSLDPILECNAETSAFARLKTVNFSCEHCLRHGQVAKAVNYFQRKHGLWGAQNTLCGLALHRYPSFALKRYSAVRWAFAELW